jgi:hypothetical protein
LADQRRVLFPDLLKSNSAGRSDRRRDYAGQWFAEPQMPEVVDRSVGSALVAEIVLVHFMLDKLLTAM